MVGVNGGDAVVLEFCLGIDEAHVIGVLLRDDGVVAAHVVEFIEHARVGVEGLLAGGIVGGDAVEALILLEKLHHRRLEIKDLGIGGRVEAVAENENIADQHQQSHRLPQLIPAQAEGAASEEQYRPAGGQE